MGVKASALLLLFGFVDGLIALAVYELGRMAGGAAVPTAVFVIVASVSTSVYLAAVYLAAGGGR